MSKKKYFFMILPILIIGLLLLFYLPEGQRPYAYLIPIVCGVIYYIWIWQE